jgi:prepilin-type N-terminal cleavage/methylation domain-containing protein
MVHRTYQSTTDSADALQLAARRPLRAPGRRAVTLVELLVVLAVALILLGSASSFYVSSRKAGDLSGDIMKVQKLIATARSFAISSPDRYYQATFWLAGSPTRPQGPSLFWIDEIQPTDPLVPATPTTVLRPQIVTPEPVSEQVVLFAVKGGTADPVHGTIQIRFFPDGSCDDASVYLIRREADRAGANYQQIKIYHPTALTKLFKDQNQPTP